MEGRIIILFAPVWTLLCLIAAGIGGPGMGLRLYAVGAIALVGTVLVSFATFELRRFYFRQRPLIRRHIA